MSNEKPKPITLVKQPGAIAKAAGKKTLGQYVNSVTRKKN